MTNLPLLPIPKPAGALTLFLTLLKPLSPISSPTVPRNPSNQVVTQYMCHYLLYFYRSSGAFRVWVSGDGNDFELFEGRNVTEVKAESRAAGVIPVRLKRSKRSSDRHLRSAMDERTFYVGNRNCLCFSCSDLLGEQTRSDLTPFPPGALESPPASSSGLRSSCIGSTTGR